MNQLIDLLDGALQANLTKRQWAAFAAILRQTLGYRKNKDDISARRLEQLTGIRRNHIWQAKNELIAIGLIKQQPGRYGEILCFASPLVSPPLSNSTTPDAPETGQPDSRIRPESVPKQDTTLRNLTPCKHNSTVGDEIVSLPPDCSVQVADEPKNTVKRPDCGTGLNYPPDLSTLERRKAPQHLDGLTPVAAQQVLDVWALKILRGEVRKSRLGLLVALVKAQRNGQLHTNGFVQSPLSPAADPQQQKRLQQREQWLEQQAQQGWLRDMARLGVLSPDQCSHSGYATGGAP